MKIKRFFSFILCLGVLIQLSGQGALAAQTNTQPGENPEETAGQQGMFSAGSSSQQSDGQWTGSGNLPYGQVSIQNGCRTIEAMRPLAGSERKLSSAQGAFLYEMNTDTVIYSYNPDMKLALGSHTKMITAIVALQYCHPDDLVTIVPGIKGRLPASSLNLDLTSDEEISVEYLLEGLLVHGATDAAVALAEYVSGNRQGFVPLMNDWVKSIGCTGTEVSTVHGVDGGVSYTTPRDLAKITREAMKNEDFARIFGLEQITIPATNKSKERSYYTLDYMHDTHIIETYYDRNVTGGFASYEDSSGANLVITKNFKNMNCIGVVLGCERIVEKNGWRVENYGNFENMVEMLKFGYDNYKVNRVIYEGMALSQFRTVGGESNAVGEAWENVDSVVPISAQMNNLTINFNTGDKLEAPIHKGDKLGTVEMWYRDSCLAEAEVFAMGDVKSSQNTGVVIHTVTSRAEADHSGILSAIGTVCVIVLGAAGAYLGFNAYMRARIQAQRRRRRVSRRRTR